MLRVLMIGNSFSQSVMHQLPRIMESEKGHKLDITCMYIGGCSLERHVQEYKKALKDPSHKPYRIYRFVSGEGDKEIYRSNLPEILESGSFDIVTLQQKSAYSIALATWKPWGDRLAEIVRAKHPDVEFVIHQTWSYRSDSALLKRWKFNQDVMYAKLSAVYADRARHFGNCRIIPVGAAVQEFRRMVEKRYSAPTPKEFKSFKYPDVPSFKGDVVGCHKWRRDKKSGKIKLTTDSIHLNQDGDYLQGCVWFGVLFGRDPLTITYKPAYLTEEEALRLRKCAAVAIEQTKKSQQ